MNTHNDNPGPEPKKIAPKKKYDRPAHVDCPNFRKLTAKVGMDRAAELVGAGYSTCSKYNTTGLAPKAIEKAAELELMKRDNKNALVPVAEELVILKVRPDQLDLLMTFLRGMNLKSMRFKDS